MVVSAPGKRNPADTKVTDLLIRYADCVIAGRDYQEIAQQIIGRYQEIALGFNFTPEDFAPIRRAILNLPLATYQDNTYLMAAFKAHGEKLNAQLIARVFNLVGIAAQYLDPSAAGLVVTDVPDDAQIKPDSYANLRKWQNNANVLVMPGFFLATMIAEKYVHFLVVALISPELSWHEVSMLTYTRTLLTLTQSMRSSQILLVTRMQLAI